MKLRILYLLDKIIGINYSYLARHLKKNKFCIKRGYYITNNKFNIMLFFIVNAIKKKLQRYKLMVVS